MRKLLKIRTYAFLQHDLSIKLFFSVHFPPSFNLTESSKSPASIAKSNKQWVGTCLYQEECKLLLINCGAVIRL